MDTCAAVLIGLCSFGLPQGPPPGFAPPNGEHAPSANGSSPFQSYGSESSSSTSVPPTSAAATTPPQQAAAAAAAAGAAWGEPAAGVNASGSPLALPSLESIWGADLQPQAPAVAAAAESGAFAQPGGAGRSRSRFQFAQDAASEQQQQLVFQQQQASFSMQQQQQQQQQPWVKPPADAGRALLQQLQQHSAAQPHAALGNGVLHVQQPGSGGPFYPPTEQTLAMGTPPGFGLGPAAAGALRPQQPPQNGYHRGLPPQAQDGQGLEARWLDAAQRFQNMAV